MNRPPTRVLPASVRGAPVYLLICGLLVTMVVGLLQQQNEEREQQLLFESEVNRIEQRIREDLEHHGADFESSINFTAATHPGPLEEYRTYFSREVPTLMEIDPGVLLVEYVPGGRTSALEARERAFGHDDFQVIGLPALGQDRYVITRTVQDIDILGLPLRGLDVTSMRSMLIPAEVPDSGFVLQIAEAEAMVALLEVETPSGEATDARFDDVTAIMIGSVYDDAGTFIGYVTRFVAVDELLGSFDELVVESLNVELFVEGIDHPIAALGDSTAIPESALTATRSNVTADLAWTVRVWTDADFGTHLGLVEQSNVWGIGLPITALAFLTLVGRNYHRRRINQAEFELEHVRALASTDALTGLLNRQGLVDSARAVDQSQPASLFFVDLDGFKSVNDMEGHEAGDRVLREVARRLREIFRPGDFVSRLGGDEFVVFTPGAGSDDYVGHVSDRITAALSTVDERVTSSVGIARRAADSGTDVKALLRAADGAMYEAKRAGGDRFVVSP